MTVLLSPGLARATGRDAGDRAMRKGCRTAWNRDDYHVAVETTARLMVLGGFLPPACYAELCGEPFPYVQGVDGSWIKRRPS